MPIAHIKPPEAITGFNAEVGWKWVALRVAKLDYSADGFKDADAGSIGVRFTWRPGAGN
jgi:hypothetical protein